MWENENLLVMSNFPFSHEVFKRLVSQTYKNRGLIWNSRLASPSSLVGSLQDFGTVGRRFEADSNETGFVPLSRVSIVPTMVMWESSQWLGKNILQSTGKKNILEA